MLETVPHVDHGIRSDLAIGGMEVLAFAEAVVPEHERAVHVEQDCAEAVDIAFHRIKPVGMCDNLAGSTDILGTIAARPGAPLTPGRS